MSIAQQTTIQAYQLRAGGSHARMAILRMIAADSQRRENPPSTHIGDWRAARHYTLGSYASAYATLHAGFIGTDRARERIWYTHAGEEFRNERDAHEINIRLPRGWYTNEDCDETAIGIVAMLTHGRYIAGYRWTSNDERVYFGQVYSDEADAARAANGHAESFADVAREDDARFLRMGRAETDMEDKTADLANVRALRRMGRRDSSDVIEAIETLRAARVEFDDATRNYERGA